MFHPLVYLAYLDSTKFNFFNSYGNIPMKAQELLNKELLLSEPQKSCDFTCRWSVSIAQTFPNCPVGYHI